MTKQKYTSSKALSSCEVKKNPKIFICVMPELYLKRSEIKLHCDHELHGLAWLTSDIQVYCDYNDNILIYVKNWLSFFVTF